MFEFSFVTPIMIKGNLKTGGSFAGWGVKTGMSAIYPVVRSAADILKPSSLDVSEGLSLLPDGSLSRRLPVERQPR